MDIYTLSKISNLNWLNLKKKMLKCDEYMIISHFKFFFNFMDNHNLSWFKMKLTVNVARKTCFCLRQFLMKKRISQKKVSKHHGYGKKELKINFFPKNRASSKTRLSETFFPCSFPKLNSLQAHIKKITKSITYIRDVPKLKLSNCFSLSFCFCFQNFFCVF